MVASIAGVLDDCGEVLDLVGIGFGPSNLAVAVALHETDACECAGIKFLERKPSFSWHQDMLLDGARMQVSFLKDLATMRNPSSQFTFLNYLLQAGRLSKFANLKTFYPSRREFNDYMQWVARQLGDDLVQYGTQVRSIEPIEEEGQIQLLRIDYTDHSGRSGSLLTRDILFSTGPRPRLPFPLDESLRPIAFHSSEFLSRLSQVKVRDGIRFVVVGGGQSAVECTLYLYSAFKNSQVTLCTRGHSLRPMDDSCFVNEIFLPENVAVWHSLDQETRATLLREYRHSNYACADRDLLDKLYEILYEQSFCEQEKSLIQIITGTELVSAEWNSGSIQCRLRSTYGDRPLQTVEADYVVFATGYNIELDPQLITKLRRYFVHGGDGRLVCDRQYRIVTTKDFLPRVIALGINEATHGIGDTLLSNMAVRAGEVISALELKRKDPINARAQVHGS